MEAAHNCIRILEDIALIAYLLLIAEDRLNRVRSAGVLGKATGSDLGSAVRARDMLRAALREATERLDQANLEAGLPMLAEIAYRAGNKAADA